MAKIVLQNQSSPTTPECGFTAMYVNSETWLPTFKRDDWTECSFVLSCWWSWSYWDMYQCIYDPTCQCTDAFSMDNMVQGSNNKYVTDEQINCWNCKADVCDIPTDYVTTAVCDLCNYYLKCETYTKAEVDCAISNFWWFCVVSELPSTWSSNLIYLKWPIGCWEDKYEEWIYNSCWILIWETSPDLSNYAKCCDIPEVPTDNCQLANWCWYVKDCDMPDLEDYAKCCDLPTDNCQLANWCGYLTTACMDQYAQLCDIPTDNSQLCNGCGYTACTWDMQKCMYDPCNCATNVYDMDNMVDWTNKVAMTTAERAQVAATSWCNTWDETCTTIQCKLWITCLTWNNTWDETCATIKCKLWAATCADDWYLKACDFTNFSNKQSALVSWENIITINWCTILRCWDICVCNSWWDMKACVYDPYGKCTDAFNRANHTGTQSYTTITWLGSSATRDVWINCWNVVVVQNNWKISSDILPAQDVVDVCVFCSEADMLAWCDANRWDMAIRTDIARTYVMSGSCPSCIDSWTILPVPTSPVTSVNWCIGDVCLTTDNISDANSSNKYVTASEKSCWCWKADPYISWTTIKTINGCSVLWCWDICIPNTITCVNGKIGNVCLTTDDISDTGAWHLFVSQEEKNCWNCKIDCADAIVDNCQLCNSCWYITSSDISNLAQCCDIPTDNCQLANTCGYTTCTWTLVACDLNGYTLSCDVLTKTNTTAYNPTSDYHPATKKYVDDKGGKTYIAGDWISIPNNTDYSAIQWPCPDWYHIPSSEENAAIVNAMTALGIDTSNWASMKTYLKMPYAWYRNQTNGNTWAQGVGWRYWSYLRASVNGASILSFQSNTNGNSSANAAYGMSIRPFKNEAVIPDGWANWTTLFDWSSIATNAWIFHNATDGIISISADWTTWITIADKNLWATVVYNDGDTLSENNAWWYFQHWNNYMFPFTWSITTSSTKVDTTNYWPWNYYSSSTFIAVSGDWSSVYNSNLWWWDVWVVIVNNIIYNAGVLSVNWQTWKVIIAAWWDVVWPSCSVDWNIVLFDWVSWKCIKDSWKSLSCYAKCCDIPDTSCLAQCCDIPDTSCLINKWMNYCVCSIDIMNWDDPMDWDHRASMNAELWFEIFNWMWCAEYNSSSISSRWWCYLFNKCACGIAQMCDIPTNNCQLSNGCWYITSADANTKTFYLSSTSDLTTAQAAYDWYAAGKNPIISYQNKNYILSWMASSYIVFKTTLSDDNYTSYTTISWRKLTFSLSDWTVSSISATSISDRVLLTDHNYPTPYTPEYNWSPATKKYVDDNKWVAECCIATINWCCLTCWWDICIEAWWWTEYWWCDYIHSDQSCCICPEHQLIIEGTLTIDGELINDWKIFII